MDDKKIILRKIKLKQQGIELQKEGIKKLTGIFGLLTLKELFETDRSRDKDATLLNKQIDCAVFLLNSLSEDNKEILIKNEGLDERKNINPFQK